MKSITKAQYAMLFFAVDRLKEDSNHPVYMIVNGKRCLGGLKNIQEQLRPKIPEMQ